MSEHRLPGPVATPLDAGFWSGCEQHELRIHHCLTCGSWHHPPLPLCPRCQSAELEWRRVEGPAVLYSWSRVHVAVHPSVADLIPYYIAVVEFPAAGGARLIARLEHTHDGPPSIGSECELFWVAADGGQPLPVFRSGQLTGSR